MSLPETFILNTITDGGSTATESEAATYTRFRQETDKTTYVGADHAVDSREKLEFYRTEPKRSGNYRGSSKTAAKFTLDVSVATVDGGTIMAPIVLELSSSIPVGADEAVVSELQRRMSVLSYYPDSPVANSPGDICHRNIYDLEV